MLVLRVFENAEQTLGSPKGRFLADDRLLNCISARSVETRANRVIIAFASYGAARCRPRNEGRQKFKFGF